MNTIQNYLRYLLHRMLLCLFCRKALAAMAVMAVVAYGAATAQTTNTYAVPEAAEANRFLAALGTTATIPASINSSSKLSDGNRYSFSNGISGTVQGQQIVITAIELSSTGLKGSLTNVNLQNLQYLRLSSNQLTGNIPDFNLPNLQVLFLHKNQLTGSIPNFNLPNLYELYLTANQLTGSIPNFNFPNLRYLDLSGNQLTGSIPNFILPNLQLLFLNNNQLTGSIPNFNLPNLQLLFLNNNQLTGSIPNFNLPILYFLYLSYNQLTGSIPNFILPNVDRLDLSYNQLTGNIPNFILPNLYVLYLNNNQLTGSIPNFNLLNLGDLSLSFNQLTGSIPNFILPNLYVLYLNNNQLTGSNGDWSRMPNLFELELSSNRFIFRDLEPAARALQGKYYWKYSPQDTLLPVIVLLGRAGDPAGATVLGASASGTQTQYRWLKNGVEVKKGSDSTVAILPNERTANYSCEMTSPLLPGLTLRTAVLTLTGVASPQNSEQSPTVYVHPNPSAGAFTVVYDLPVPRWITVELYSAMGQKVLTLFAGQAASGKTAYVVDMHNYPSGTYILRLQSPEGVESTVLSVVK